MMTGFGSVQGIFVNISGLSNSWLGERAHIRQELVWYWRVTLFFGITPKKDDDDF